MAFTFTINGNTYTSDPANLAVPDGYRFNGYGYITALANLVQDIVAAAMAQVALAAAQVPLAAAQVTLAATQANNAGAQAAAAASSAASAAGAPGTNATSTTPLTIGMGAQVLTIQAGKLYAVGQQIMIASTAVPTNWMAGTVTAYSSATGALAVTVANFNGGGTVAAWTVSLIGAPGVSGLLNELKGTDIASAAMINLTAATGNFVHVTGTTSIAGITIPPGAERTVVFDGVLTLTYSAALLLPGGSDIVTAAGDRMVVRGDNGGAIVVAYTRANGQSVFITKQFRAITYLTTSGVFTAPANGLLRITLRGADGSGAAVLGLNSSSASAVASGGAAGALAIKTLRVSAGDTFSATLAAGGAQVSTSTAGTSVNGVPGGTSTITGPNTNMTANGGAGGIGAITAAGPITAAGAIGGTASGGDANYTGGGSGIAAVTVGGGVAATGGGAVAWNGTAYSSGNATVSAPSGNPAGAASGGAGTGGASGVALRTTVAQGTTTGGGGAMGASPSATDSAGAQGSGMPSVVSATPLSLTGQGNSGAGGAGGGAAANTGTIVTGTAGGPLAGGGAAVIYGSPSSNGTCLAAGGSGGSTGGAASRASAVTVTVTAQAGANAFAIFEWAEV